MATFGVVTRMTNLSVWKLKTLSKRLKYMISVPETWNTAKYSCRTSLCDACFLDCLFDTQCPSCNHGPIKWSGIRDKRKVCSAPAMILAEFCLVGQYYRLMYSYDHLFLFRNRAKRALHFGATGKGAGAATTWVHSVGQWTVGKAGVWGSSWTKRN